MAQTLSRLGRPDVARRHALGAIGSLGLYALAGCGDRIPMTDFAMQDVGHGSC